jgi:hypothetical protein
LRRTATELMNGLVSLLPAAERDDRGPCAGRTFKSSEVPTARKSRTCGCFGALHVRDRVHDEDKVTGISVFERGASVRRAPFGQGILASCGASHVQVCEPIGMRRVDAGAAPVPADAASPDRA